MKQRRHFFIIASIILICLILASFFDLQIATVVFSKNNGFGLFMAASGTLPGYIGLSFFGGLLLILELNNKKHHPIIRYSLMILGFITFALSFYLQAGEIISENSYNYPKLTWLGYLISFPFTAGGFVLGILLGKKVKTPYAWVVVLLVLLVCAVALVPGVTLLKNIFNRPRFRTSIEHDYFQAWWDPLSKSDRTFFMKQWGVGKEEFKSFPSGHTCCAAITMCMVVFLPCIFPQLEKYHVPMFYGAFIWTVFIGFTRMLVGAHYLSDVAMGALILVICLYIGNEIYFRLLLPRFNNEEVVNNG